MDGGPAPAPSAQAVPSWTSGAKDLVMTALGSSRVWATTGQGIFTEIYWPAVDQPQVKDLGFLIGGTGWWQEVKRAGHYVLYCKYTDDYVVIEPDSHPGWMGQ